MLFCKFWYWEKCENVNLGKSRGWGFGGGGGGDGGVSYNSPSRRRLDVK